MTRKMLLTLSLVLAAGMAVVGALVASRVPATLELPMHWNIHGEADRYGSKWTALMSAPALTLLLAALFWFLPAIEPRERNLERSRGLYLSTWAGVLILMAAIEVVMLSAALHWGLGTEAVITGSSGVAFVLVGNQLGKSRRMYLVGFRTPWTLASEEVWIKTHRLAGKLMVAWGLVTFLAALVPISSVLRGGLFAAGGAILLSVSVLYSYWLWRRERSGAQASE